MALTTFDFDKKMEEALEQLKSYYGASSKAEILRKAVALLKIAQESEDGSLFIRKDGEVTKIVVK